MLLSTHLELAKKWEAALNKLDRQADHLVVIEICMMMGTTLMNAVLHKRGIAGEPYDQNHTTRPDIPPEVAAKITPDVREMMDNLFYIEGMRNLHCRGIRPDLRERDLPEWDPAVVDKCVANLMEMKAFAEKVCSE